MALPIVGLALGAIGVRIVMALITFLPYILGVIAPFVFLWVSDIFKSWFNVSSSIFLTTFDFVLSMALPDNVDLSLSAIFDTFPDSIKNALGMIYLGDLLDMFITAYITKMLIIVMLKLKKGITSSISSGITGV
jgi:hypothetical protein